MAGFQGLPQPDLVSVPQVSAVGYGMDEVEQDQHEARLKELFDSFDTTGTGSLGQEELTDLCHMLSLEEVAPVLQETLLQDNLLGRVRLGEERRVEGCGFFRGAGDGANHTYRNLFLTFWLCAPSALNLRHRPNVMRYRAVCSEDEGLL